MEENKETNKEEKTTVEENKELKQEETAPKKEDKETSEKAPAPEKKTSGSKKTKEKKPTEKKEKPEADIEVETPKNKKAEDKKTTGKYLMILVPPPASILFEKKLEYIEVADLDKESLSDAVKKLCDIDKDIELVNSYYNETVKMGQFSYPSGRRFDIVETNGDKDKIKKTIEDFNIKYGFN